MNYQDPAGTVRTILDRAQIPETDLPSSFAAWQFLEDLQYLKERRELHDLLGRPGATKADAASLDTLSRLTARMRKELDELSSSLRFKLEVNLDDLHGMLGKLDASIGRIGSDVDVLIEDGPLIRGGPSGLEWLAGKGIPDLFEKHLGRPCGVGVEEVNQRPTQGVLFICAVLEHMGNGPTTPEAARRAHYRGQPPRQP